MAKMIDALIVKLCLKRIEALKARKTFLESLHTLSVQRSENKHNSKTEKARLLNELDLARLALKNKVETKWVRKQKDIELERIETKFRLKYRIIRENFKRKLKKDPDSEALTKTQVQAFENLAKKKSLAVEKINAKYAFDPETEAKNVSGYMEQKSILENSLNQKLEKLKTIHETKLEKLNHKFIEKTNLFQTKVDRLKEFAKQKSVNLPKIDQGVPEDVILRLEHLTMRFGGLVAVDDLSFDVKSNEIFGLIGPNGAGKTTVFNCITKFYRPASGMMYFRKNPVEVIELNDYPVHKIVRQGIVRTFQNVELVWELSVLDNLLVAAHSLFRTRFFGQLFHIRKLKLEESVLKAKAMAILKRMGLEAYAYAIPYGLPYGILKKIELARTLMVDPKMIILDEPAAGLNDQETDELARIIRSIRDELEVTIFLVEHDMGLVMDVCDTIAAISFGKLLAMGTPAEIQANKIVKDAYLGEE